jgi:hypothetical protein
VRSDRSFPFSEGLLTLVSKGHHEGRVTCAPSPRSDRHLKRTTAGLVVARSTESSMTALEVLAGAVEITGFAIAIAHVEVWRRVEAVDVLVTRAWAARCR